jgi:hypothetical protein
MIEFKNADLAAQQEDLSAYAAAPIHSIMSLATSTQRFLDRHEPWVIQLTDPAPLHSTVPPYFSDGHDAVVGGLEFELDSYLHEPLMKHVRIDNKGHKIWCDPLLYWAVCTFPPLNNCFSPMYVGC